MLKGLQQFLRPCHCHHDHRHFDKELLNFSTKSCFHTQFNFLGKYTRVQHQYNKEKQIASFMESLPAMTTLHAANGASKNVIPVTQDSCVSSIEELLREDPLPERDSKRMPENLLSPSASRGNIPVVSQAELIRNSNKIKLTEKEREILDLLKLCCKQFNLDLTLRVAGGWVRDKVPYIISVFEYYCFYFDFN